MATDIGKLVLKALKSQAKTVGLRAAMLIKSTPGARTEGNLSGGTNPTTTNYQCQALIEVLTIDDMPAMLVQVNDRKIGILGASLAAGIVPAKDDKITLVDVDGVSKTFRLVAAVSGDGVGAMYEFVVRV
jgi:hypothetical protein